jgi:hypothetical protein
MKAYQLPLRERITTADLKCIAIGVLMIAVCGYLAVIYWKDGSPIIAAFFGYCSLAGLWSLSKIGSVEMDERAIISRTILGERRLLWEDVDGIDVNAVIAGDFALSFSRKGRRRRFELPTVSREMLGFIKEQFEARGINFDQPSIPRPNVHAKKIDPLIFVYGSLWRLFRKWPRRRMK